MLPNFVRLKTARDNMEVIFDNLYDVSFRIPDNIIGGRDTSLLIENTKDVKFNTLPAFNKAEQEYKFSKRAFIGFPDTTLTDVEITFNLNHDDKNAIYVYNVLKAWYDTVWNSQTGETALKRNMVGDIIVNQHDKEGNVLRRVALRNCQMNGLTITAMNDLKWGSQANIAEATGKWVADYWEELYIDSVGV